MKTRVPIRLSRTLQGVSLEFDSSQETVTVLRSDGEPLVSASYGAVIQHIYRSAEGASLPEKRAFARAPLAVRIEYETPEGTRSEGLSGDLGGGGLFLESSAVIPRGTELKVEFGLPETPEERITAGARVAWIRTSAERYLFPSGMGLEFTTISEQHRSKIIEFIDALNRVRGQGT